MPLTTMAEHFQKTGEMPLETENCSETDMSNKALMIARQIEAHKEVMIVKTLGKKCKTKWWLPSGSEVLALMKGDSTEYMQIFLYRIRHIAGLILQGACYLSGPRHQAT